MMTPAFSTVACPDWTLAQIAERAPRLGFGAIELRTFGGASRRFACDPALTDEAKTRALLGAAGIDPVCIATGVRFDEPVFPPVIGLFSRGIDRSVREGNYAVDLAVGIECPLVRVFGYEWPAREKRAAGIKRICDRLISVVDHADKTGVRVVLENGGSLSTSADLLEVMDLLASPLLGAAYSPGPAIMAGEDPAAGVANLGARLFLARVKDVRDGRPCLLGEGELRCREFVAALVGAGFQGPLVFEWDRAWVEGIAPAEEALAHGARTLYHWIAPAGAPPPKPGRITMTAPAR